MYANNPLFKHLECPDNWYKSKNVHWSLSNLKTRDSAIDPFYNFCQCLAKYGRITFNSEYDTLPEAIDKCHKCLRVAPSVLTKYSVATKHIMDSIQSFYFLLTENHRVAYERAKRITPWDQMGPIQQSGILALKAVYYQMMDKDGCRRSVEPIKRAIVLNSSSPELYYFAARILRSVRSDRFFSWPCDEEVALATRACGLEGRVPYLAHLGTALAHRGHYLKPALHLSPESREYFRAARQLFEKIVVVNRSRGCEADPVIAARSLYQIATVCSLEDELWGLTAQFEDLLSRYPYVADVSYHCGLFYLKIGRANKALECFLRSRERYYPSAVMAYALKTRSNRNLDLEQETNLMLAKFPKRDQASMTHRKAAEAYLLLHGDALNAARHVVASILIDNTQGIVTEHFVDETKTSLHVLTSNEIRVRLTRRAYSSEEERMELARGLDIIRLKYPTVLAYPIRESWVAELHDQAAVQKHPQTYNLSGFTFRF